MGTGAGSAAVSRLFCNGEPVADSALAAPALVNYGHFTSLRCVDGAVRGLDLHLQRLEEGTQVLFGAGLAPARIRAGLRQAFEALGQRDAWLRASVFARDFDFAAPLRPVAPDLLVSATPASDWAGPPLRVQPVRYQRHRPELKHAGTFALFDLRRQAMAGGWDDALFIDGSGQLVEGTTWNLGLWSGEGVTWPAGPALRGTQERLLQQGLAAIGARQQVRPVQAGELGRFQGAFACNARGIRAIGAIGGHGFDAGEPWRAVLAQALESQPWQPL